MFVANVEGLYIDRKSGEFLVLVREEAGDRSVPIWIQFHEMLALAKELSQEALRSPRPLTHDLFSLILGELGARIDRIRITGLTKGIYHARLYVATSGTKLEVDARASDAIVLALKFEAPVEISDTVFREHIRLTEAAGETPEGLRKRLQPFRPEDFVQFSK